MADLSDEEFEAATERGRVLFETEPHARSARFDRGTGMLVLQLYNDAVVSVPARRLRGLADATDDQIGEIELVGMGYGLHWESLDADFTVKGLANGVFGTPAYMAGQRARLREILHTLESGRRSAAA